VAIHAVTDGRDVAPQSAARVSLKNLKRHVLSGDRFFATCAGRYYAMDGDKNWTGLKRAEDAMFKLRGECLRQGKALEASARLHKTELSTKHLEPLVFLDEQRQGLPD